MGQHRLRRLRDKGDTANFVKGKLDTVLARKDPYCPKGAPVVAGHVDIDIVDHDPAQRFGGPRVLQERCDEACHELGGHELLHVPEHSEPPKLRADEWHSCDRGRAIALLIIVAARMRTKSGKPTYLEFKMRVTELPVKHHKRVSMMSFALEELPQV